MKKLAESVLAVAGRIIFIGFSIQIVTGIAWMFGNFLSIQHLAEPGSLCYLVILKAARGMESIFHIPYYCILYVLQAAACFWSVYYVTGRLRQNKGTGAKAVFMRIWSTLAILTAVPVMQCIMSVLPYAFLMALMCVQLYFAAVSIVGKKEKNHVRCIIYLLIVWLAEALLGHEYFLFGAVPVVSVAVSYVYDFIRKKNKADIKRAALISAGAVITAAVLFMVYGLCTEKGLYEEENPGLVKGLFRRSAYTTVFKNWDNWTDEITENIDLDVIYAAAYYADNIALELEPYVDEKFGDEAENFYKSVTAGAWEDYRTQLVHEVIWDAAGYIAAPVIMDRQLRGEGTASLTVRNYDMLKRSTPVLAKYYFGYFIYFFKTALVISAVGIVCGIISKRRLYCSSLERSFLLTGAFTAVCMAVRYILMGACIMDYKKTIITMVLWIYIFTICTISTFGCREV